MTELATKRQTGRKKGQQVSLSPHSLGAVEGAGEVVGQLHGVQLRGGCQQQPQHLLMRLQHKWQHTQTEAWRSLKADDESLRRQCVSEEHTPGGASGGHRLQVQVADEQDMKAWEEGRQ